MMKADFKSTVHFSTLFSTIRMSFQQVGNGAPGPPDLLPDHFFDLPNLFLNHTFVVFGLASSL
jgi:hypothetical protein